MQPPIHYPPQHQPKKKSPLKAILITVGVVLTLCLGGVAVMRA